MAGSKLQARSKLAPVLEDYYMEPVAAAHVDYETDAVVVLQKKLGAAAPAKGRKPVKGSKESRSPLRLLGKLRDAYVKMMNDMAERGEMSAVGLYHGVAVPYTYPCRAAFQSGTTKDYNDCELLTEFFRHECQARTHEVTKP